MLVRAEKRLVRPDDRIEEYESVGKSPPRTDARDKVNGSALYMEDMKFNGMLYGKVFRSKYAHARILSIDVSRAAKLPGVRGIVTGRDLPFVHGESLIDEPFLARDKVRYKGEAVAVVGAVDEEAAEEALELISVEYEELPPLFDLMEAARPGAVLIHEGLENYPHAPWVRPIKGTNICNHFQVQRGNIEVGFAESDHIFEDTFTTQMQQHCSLEPHGAICLINSDSAITLWANNDSPYRCRTEIANALKIPLTDVRVITVPNIGGNFGGKGGLKAEAAAIALAWKVRNRPIKIMYTREEEFCSSLARHPSVIQMKTGVEKDGTILAREVRIYLDTGAYAEKGSTVSRQCALSAAGPYRAPNVKVDAYCVYTNRPVTGAMRGYGGPQAAWACESQMDIIADKLGIDPLEFRLRHIYDEGEVDITGNPFDSAGLKECLKEVASRMEWGSKPLGKDRGRGIACMLRSVKTPSGSAAFVKVNEDGTVDVLSSTTEVGQGSSTVLRQIAAEELGVPLESVRKAAPDTAFTPFDTSTTSSRSTFYMGNAVKMAAADAKEQILRMAAQLWRARPEHLKIKYGKVCIEGEPDKTVPVAKVLSQHCGPCGTVLGRGFYMPQIPEAVESYYTVFWLLGAGGAEVEVNRKTGQVKVLKIWAAHDAGKAVHPVNCEAQIQGGVSMGLGFALSEEIVLKEGDVMNPSFLSYKLPSALDVPEIVPIVVEHPQADGPYGAKGFGEVTNVPVPPAIANAIYNAVGVRIKNLPITPDKILEALKRKNRQRKDGPPVPHRPPVSSRGRYAR
ncbi:MAG: xanthine dehydrogenase family protein molybdopterin-binding subunit [Deltaproteobacteria bacterium]|nr:xanthine dehydrogenase family protein molybdopterin-binding subunit [Deltaproteobacteria bacterium]